jgi:hypothetical protein
LMASSIDKPCPRLCAFISSECHTGMVLVFNPFPRPATILPTIICGIEYDDACSVAPTIIVEHPTRIDFLRPSISPMNKLAMAPKKHPVEL